MAARQLHRLSGPSLLRADRVVMRRAERHQVAHVVAAWTTTAEAVDVADMLGGVVAVGHSQVGLRRSLRARSLSSAASVDRLRDPLGRGSFLRTLLRGAAAKAQDGGRDDALASLASLAEHDVRVGRVVHEIEMKDRLDRLRLLAGD